MATIRAFTTIEQSRKLAEILPLESADMFYLRIIGKTYDKYGELIPLEENLCKIEIESLNRPNYPEEDVLPCWSLAALLELLPKRLEIVDNVYELSVYLYGLYYWNITNGNLLFEAKDKDNLVDACYELILKLNELKML